METAVRVLLLEDDAGQRRSYQRFLLTQGCAVTETDSVASAALALRRERFDLLLLDYFLGEGTATGLDFLERARDAGCSTPAALVSGVADDKVLARAIGLGVCRFIPKGGRLAELCAVIE